MNQNTVRLWIFPEREKNPNLPLEDCRKYLKTVCTFEMTDTEFCYNSEKFQIQQENSDTVSEMKVLISGRNQ